MMHFSKTLKTTAVAGLFSLGFLGASSGPALANRSYLRCDRDGDRCWRVVCDNDGDDCRRYRIDTGYNGYRHRDWNYDSGAYRHDRYDGRRWVCDRDGDDCHWNR